MTERRDDLPESPEVEGDRPTEEEAPFKLDADDEEKPPSPGIEDAFRSGS